MMMIIKNRIVLVDDFKKAIKAGVSPPYDNC